MPKAGPYVPVRKIPAAIPGQMQPLAGSLTGPALSCGATAATGVTAVPGVTAMPGVSQLTPGQSQAEARAPRTLCCSAGTALLLPDLSSSACKNVQGTAPQSASHTHRAPSVEGPWETTGCPRWEAFLLHGGSKPLLVRLAPLVPAPLCVAAREETQGKKLTCSLANLHRTIRPALFKC